jgi:hypothetical protein
MIMYSVFTRTDPVALAAAQSARADAQRADHKAAALEVDVERLLMISEALWTMLKEKHGYTDEVLEQRIMDIDLRDGKLDGRVADSPPGKCPKCDRPLMKRRPRCMYCGEIVSVEVFER